MNSGSLEHCATEDQARGGIGAEPQFQADYARVQALLAGDAEAERWFQEEYGNRLMQTAISWCRPNCYRTACRLKGKRWNRLLEYVLGNDCDEVADAYSFLLGEIKGRILRGYAGGASLRTYLFPILRPVSRPDAQRQGLNYRRLLASYLVWKRGHKYVAPHWVHALPELDQEVHKQTFYGRDAMQVAQKLRMEVSKVEESLGRLDESARREGPDTAWTWLVIRTGGVTSLDGPLPGHGEEESGVTVMDSVAAQQANPEEEYLRREAEAIRRSAVEEQALAMERLPREHYHILMKRAAEGLTIQEAAKATGLTPKQLYTREEHALQQVETILRKRYPDGKALDRKDLLKAAGAILRSRRENWKEPLPAAD